MGEGTVFKKYINIFMLCICLIFSKSGVCSKITQVEIESVKWEDQIPDSEMTVLVSVMSQRAISLVHCRIYCEKREGDTTVYREFWKEQSIAPQQEDGSYSCEFYFQPFGRTTIEAWAIEETGEKILAKSRTVGEVVKLEEREEEDSESYMIEEEEIGRENEGAQGERKKEEGIDGTMFSDSEDSIGQSVTLQDTSKPRIAIEGITPFANVKTAISITIEMEDENLDIQQSRVSLIQKTKQREVTPSYEQKEEGKMQIQYHNLDEDGKYSLEVVARDTAGNESKRSFSFSINQIGTKFQVISNIKPYMRETPSVQILLENQKPVSILSCTLNGEEVNYEYRDKKVILPATIWSEGRQRLCLLVRDMAGNINQMPTLNFILDRTKPEIIVKGVDQNQVYYGERTIEIYTKNGEDELSSICMNGREITKFLEREKNRVSFSVKEYKECNLKIRAKDRAGNESDKTISFQIRPYYIWREKKISPVHIVYFLSLSFILPAAIFIKKGIKEF